MRAAETLTLELCEWGLQAFQLLSLSIACPLYCANFYVTTAETAVYLLIVEKVYEH